MPKKIGKYEISGIAGKGAMGIVYIGHDPYIDRKVAIKVSIKPDVPMADADESIVAENNQQFFNEAKAAGILDHPNIIKVYEAGDANGQNYIAIEFVEDADTLRSFKDKESLLPVKRLLKYIRQSALALHYAHSQGITHRDIKPANLLLSLDDEIKIADFGIAIRKVTDETVAEKAFGSPLYMSPEQVNGQKITYQTDIFSLGVVMYELLTGTHPFLAKTMPVLFKNISSEQPKPLQELMPDLPASLEDIITKALQKDPQDRYANGLDFLTDLTEVELELETFGENLTFEKKLGLLKNLKFFNGFSEPEIEEILEQGEWEIHQAGSKIFIEDSQDQDFYIITSGNTSISRMDKEIATLSEGECFGEMAWIIGGNRSATVTALTKTVVLKLEEPLADWASIPCQMRVNKTIQRVLVERLTETSQRYSRIV